MLIVTREGVTAAASSRRTSVPWSTVKGGLGTLRERPRGEGWNPGQPWRALSRPTWRSDIRATAISRTRVNLHHKIVKHAAFTGQLES